MFTRTTTILVCFNLIIFILYFLIVGSTEGALSAQEVVESQVLIFGSFVTSGVAQGMVWLLVTSTFLHFAPLHILFNMLALFESGRVIENFFGRKLVFILFVLGGFLGSLATYLITISSATNIMSIGASGGVFALIGFIFGKSVLQKDNEFTRDSSVWMQTLILALAISFLPQVNWMAHIVGLLTGVAFSFVVKNYYSSLSTINKMVNITFYILLSAVVISYILLLVNLFTDFAGFRINVI